MCCRCIDDNQQSGYTYTICVCCISVLYVVFPEIDLKAHGVEAKLSNMYLDPSGQHLILAFSPRDSQNPAEVMYLGPKGSKPKEIPKLRSHIITAVAWNPSIELTNPNATNPFLLGTSKGLLFEADIANAEVKISKQVVQHENI